MKEKLKSYGLILLGIAVTAMAISLFLVPNKIVNGGSSGLSTVVFYAVGLKPSVTNALINGVLLLVSLFVLGKKFVAKTLVCIVLLSVFMELFSWMPPVTDNILLATLFGSALFGGGSGNVTVCRRAYQEPVRCVHDRLPLCDPGGLYLGPGAGLCNRCGRRQGVEGKQPGHLADACGKYPQKPYVRQKL